jgi:hypothetical protein
METLQKTGSQESGREKGSGDRADRVEGEEGGGAEKDEG